MIPEKYDRVDFEFHDRDQPTVKLKHDQTDLVYRAVQSLSSLGRFDVVFCLGGVEISRLSKNEILNQFKWGMF